MGRPDRLDLLLLTDEVHNAEFSRYNRSFTQAYVTVFRALGVTAEDVATVERDYGVKEYLFTIPAPPDPALQDKPIIVPVFPHRPSLALCDLATVAAAQGYNVTILDNVLRWKFRQQQMLRLIETEKPRLIGISTTLILATPAVESFIAMVRAAGPESKIAIGGPTVRRVKSLHDAADFAVFGSGEGPLLGILEVLDGKRAPASVPNIAYRTDTGETAYGTLAKDVTLQIGKAYKADPNERIPVSDWSLYNRGRSNVYGIEFSRGCKYNCYYCSYDRGKNTRPLEDVRHELLKNAAMGITKYRFADSNFTDGPPHRQRYPHEICRLMIDLDLGLQWSCYARVDDISPELADLMKRAGCFAVFFGVESGDDSILRLMRKGHNSADARNGIEVAKNAGLFVHANFIVGYPGETRETWRNTVDFMKSTRSDSYTIGQFFLEENAPVASPKMSAFKIQGSETTWSHSTMTSEEADTLIALALDELQTANAVVGSEYEFAVRMSLGASFEEVRTGYDLGKVLISPQTAPDERQVARERLRERFLQQIPAAIATEQKLMATD